MNGLISATAFALTAGISTGLRPVTRITPPKPRTKTEILEGLDLHDWLVQNPTNDLNRRSGGLRATQPIFNWAAEGGLEQIYRA